MAQLKIDLIVDDKGSIVVSKFGGNVAKDLGTAGSYVDNFGKRLAVGGAAIGAFVTAFGTILALVGGKGLQVFADIETRLIGVQKTTDFTAKEMATFGAAITDMGRRVPVATAALLDIAGVAGQLGIKGVGNVAKFTEVVGKLSLATDIVGAEGAASIARLLNVTGEGIDTVDKFGAVIVALGNNSAATESEILGLATEVGLATSVFSVTSSDALALGAAMKSIGIQAELGGSVVGRAMRTIEASIAAGGDEIKNLSIVTGIAEKDLKQAFGDNATLVFQKWLQGIGGMIEGGMTAAEALEMFGLKGEEVLKVLPTMAVNTGVLDNALRLANDEMERGTALEIESAKAGEAFAAQMDIGRNILTEMGFAIGAELAPEMKGLIGNFKEWWIENDKIITQDIAGNIGDLATVVFQNKDAIISLFGGLAQAAAATVEGVGNVVRSIQGLAIVAASKDKSLASWLIADPADMKVWQDEILSGVAFMKDRLVEVREKISETQDSWGNWKDKEKLLEPLRAEEARLVVEIENRGKATTAAGEAATTAGAAVVEAEKNVQTSVQATVEKHKELDRSLFTTGNVGVEQYDKIDDAINKYFTSLDKATQKEAERTRSLEQSRIATERHILALNGIQNAAGTVEDSFVTLVRLNKEYEESTQKTTEKAGMDWSMFATGASYSVRNVLGDSLRGEFNSIGEAWKGLTDRMLSTFLGIAAEMAAAGLADKIFGTYSSSGQKESAGWIDAGLDFVTGLFEGSGSGSGGSGGAGSGSSGSGWIGPAIDVVTGIFGFAEGGIHPGGLRVVGEKGPELEFTGPSTILSNSDSKSFLSGAGGLFPLIMMLSQSTATAGEKLAIFNSVITSLGQTSEDIADSKILTLTRAINMAGAASESAADIMHGLNEAHEKESEVAGEAAKSKNESTEATTAGAAATKAESAAKVDSALATQSLAEKAIAFGIDAIATAAKVATTSVATATLGVVGLAAAKALSIGIDVLAEKAKGQFAGTGFFGANEGTDTDPGTSGMTDIGGGGGMGTHDPGGGSGTGGAAGGSEATGPSGPGYGDDNEGGVLAATGGWLGAHPDGGLIREGSGSADDVFLGMINGRANWGMGREFVVNQRQTAKYWPELLAINNDTFADGGMIGGLRGIIQSPPRLLVENGSGSISSESSGMEKQIAEMRNDMKAALHAIAGNTEKILSIVRRWEGQGMPLRG